jgi:hypothetical protein
MFLEKICAPALIYIIFSLVQIGIDTAKGNFTEAFMKIWVALVFTVLLNYLCEKGLGIISWMLVFIPFILMSSIVGVLLIIFGLDKKGGRINIPVEKKVENPIVDIRELEIQKQEEQQNIKEEVPKQIEITILTDKEKALLASNVQDNINNQINQADIQNNRIKTYVETCNNLKDKELAPTTITACTTLLSSIKNVETTLDNNN